MTNPEWEEDFDKLWPHLAVFAPGLGQGEAAPKVKDFIRSLLASQRAELETRLAIECDTHSIEAVRRDRAELVGKFDKVLWAWPPEIVTTMDEAKKSEYRESLKKQVLALLVPDSKEPTVCDNFHSASEFCQGCGWIKEKHNLPDSNSNV